MPRVPVAKPARLARWARRTRHPVLLQGRCRGSCGDAEDGNSARRESRHSTSLWANRPRRMNRPAASASVPAMDIARATPPPDLDVPAEPAGGPAPPARRPRAHHPDDGAVYRDQGGASGLPAVLPDGGFLRAVLRGCGDRLAGARHRAHQARQAPGPRHPDVRGADRALGGISAPADRARPPGRGLRADRGSGGSEEARQQERGAARRGAAGHARHAHRGHAARGGREQLSDGDRARARLRRGGGPVRDLLDRHLDRRVPHRRMRPARAQCRDRAARAGRDHRLGRALRRCRARALSARAAGGDAAAARRVRRRDRRAAARQLFRGLDHAGVRGAEPARADRGGRLHLLCGAHPARAAPAAVAAGARARGRDARHRPGHAGQSRAGAGALGRAARIALGRHRPHRHAAGRAPAGAAARRPAHRSARDRAPARRGRLLPGGCGRARRDPRAAQGGARSRPGARPPGGRPRRPARPRRHPGRHRGGRRPRREARANARAAGRDRAGHGGIGGARSGDRAGAWPRARRRAAAHQARRRLPARGLCGGARRGPGAARRIAPGDRRPAGTLCRGERRALAQDPPQQRARLFRRGDRAERRQVPAPALERDLHPPPDLGRAGALHHHRAGRARGQDRPCGRARARHRAQELRGALRPGDGGARRDHPCGSGAGEPRRRLGPRRARGRARLCAAGDRRLARFHHRGRPPSGGGAGAPRRRRPVRRQ